MARNVRGFATLVGHPFVIACVRFRREFITLMHIVVITALVGVAYTLSLRLSRGIHTPMVRSVVCTSGCCPVRVLRVGLVRVAPVIAGVVSLGIPVVGPTILLVDLLIPLVLVG